MDYSPLERLPAELMQTIFLLSGYNIALARASRCIGDLLSNEYIYHSVCDHYLARRHDCHVEQSKAQTSIFATKWMTWTFFQKWIIRTYQRKGCLCGRTPEKGCFDDQWPPAFENPTSMVFSRSHLPRLAFIHGRIPTKLLHRPWTQDKIQFLRFLLWLTSMTVDWMNPEVHRLVTNGRRQAFLDQNLDAVILFNHNRRLGKPPNLSVIRFAIIDAGCNRSIVFDTMLAAYIWGRRGHSWQCPELDKWCENRIKLGDMKGHWVKAQLDEYRRTEHAGVVRWKYDGVGWAREDGIVQEPCRTWSSQHNHIDTKAGDYDGGPEDTLVRPKLCWNSVSVFSHLIYNFSQLYDYFFEPLAGVFCNPWISVTMSSGRFPTALLHAASFAKKWHWSSYARQMVIITLGGRLAAAIYNGRVTPYTLH